MHWFGTDAYGRDVLTRTLWGGQISLLIAISVACLSTVIGTSIGLYQSPLPATGMRAGLAWRLRAKSI